MTVFRGRWLVVAGVAVAVAVVLTFAVAGLDEPGVGRGRPLGVRLQGWVLAMSVLVAFLAAQLVLNERMTLLRERRMVQAASALRVAKAELEQLARTDAVTGLLNRRAFHDELGVEFRRSQRYGRAFSLLMIDIDHFKLINDDHGHQFGDFVLAELSGVLRASLRESDIVARYGGEEFVVMLPETPGEDALGVAEKLRAAVASRAFARAGHGAAVTVSIGLCSLAGRQLESEDELVRAADEALYEAKRAGRDRVVTAEAA